MPRRCNCKPHQTGHLCRGSMGGGKTQLDAVVKIGWWDILLSNVDVLPDDQTVTVGLCCQTLAGFPIRPRRSDVSRYGCVGTLSSNFGGLCDQTLTFGRVPLWVRRDFVVKLYRCSRSGLDVRTCPVMGASGLRRQILAGFPNVR